MPDFRKKIKDIDLHRRTLYVVYRVCDSMNAVSSYGRRCFSVGKAQLIQRCLSSIKPSVSNLDERIDMRVRVVADNCSDRTVDFARSVFG